MSIIGYSLYHLDDISPQRIKRAALQRARSFAHIEELVLALHGTGEHWLKAPCAWALGRTLEWLTRLDRLLTCSKLKNKSRLRRRIRYEINSIVSALFKCRNNKEHLRVRRMAYRVLLRHAENTKNEGMKMDVLDAFRDTAAIPAKSGRQLILELEQAA